LKMENKKNLILYLTKKMKKQRKRKGARVKTKNSKRLRKQVQIKMIKDLRVQREKKST